MAASIIYLDDTIEMEFNNKGFDYRISFTITKNGYRFRAHLIHNAVIKTNTFKSWPEYILVYEDEVCITSKVINDKIISGVYSKFLDCRQSINKLEYEFGFEILSKKFLKACCELLRRKNDTENIEE